MDTQISYLYELSLRRCGTIAERNPITGPWAVKKCIEPLLVDADRELFVVLALDARNRPIGTNIVSIGSLSASVVHPREVFKFAILANANALILAHNHPSGDPEPSQDDREITKRLQEAGTLMGIEILDHLILGESWLSFKERGWMWAPIKSQPSL